MTAQSALSTYLGVGLYSFPEAARLIGVEPRVLRRWAKEYAYIDKGAVRQHMPVISRHFGKDSDTLSFLELIELLFVKTFRAEGVSMQAIRKAAERAAERFHTPYPFAVKRFDTDGKHIFATLEEEATDIELIEELGKGQLAFDRVVKPLFHRLDYETNALRYWPLDHNGRVVLDPKRAFGKPIDNETGVPTEVLYNAIHAEGGQSPESVAEWYEVPVEAVIAAINYETSLRQQTPLAA
jgi:uncharacterized protein (DUF433 family)